jgi:hypothetical protein
VWRTKNSVHFSVRVPDKLCKSIEKNLRLLRNTYRPNKKRTFSRDGKILYWRTPVTDIAFPTFKLKRYVKRHILYIYGMQSADYGTFKSHQKRYILYVKWYILYVKRYILYVKRYILFVISIDEQIKWSAKGKICK